MQMNEHIFLVTEHHIVGSRITCNKIGFFLRIGRDIGANDPWMPSTRQSAIATGWKLAI